MGKKKYRSTQLEDSACAFEGAVLATENARRFIKDAELLRKDGSPAHAHAMVIFAQEEAVKGFVLFLIYLRLLDTSAWEVLMYHTPKHAVKLLIEFIESSFSGPLETYLRIIDAGQSNEHAGSAGPNTIPMAVGEAIVDAPSWLSERLDIHSFVQDFRQLEKERQLNLYVDYSGQGQWSSPTTAGNTDFTELIAPLARRLDTLESSLAIISRHPEFVNEWVDAIRPLLDQITTERKASPSDTTPHKPV